MARELTMPTWARRAVVAALLLAAVATRAADVAPEHLEVKTLGAPSPHWLLVNDPVYALVDTRAYLFDADTGAMLGMLSTGAWRNAVEFAPGFAAIYSPETYYSRGTRGERTDVVSIYDPTTLGAVGEIVIPPKRASGLSHRAYSGISDDGRFVYVANMTPKTSISVVDVARGQVAEIETAGCALTYPVGNRTVLTLCGNGTVQRIKVGDDGRLESREATPAFFDPNKDPVTEKAARQGDTWLFVTYAGMVHPVSVRGEKAEVGQAFSLFTDAERAAGWKVGGTQFMALHEASDRLFVIVHQGGPGSHKAAGSEVWVYDLGTRRKSGEITLAEPASAIAVSVDDAPLLYAADGETPAVFVYDAVSGAQRRIIEGPPFNPGILQPVIP